MKSSYSQGTPNRLAVCGSRTLDDERVKIILLEEIEDKGITEIVTHGEPEGVCEVARRLCRERAIPLKLHFLNFRYLRGAFEKRSRAVFDDCDRAIFVHDGESKGTANELKLAKKMGLPFVLHELKPSAFHASVGFDVQVDWVDAVEQNLCMPDPGSEQG